MHATRTHIQAAIYVPDTSLSGACNAHKDLFRTRMNTRCHIRGSGVCAALTEREREKKVPLCNTQGHNLSVLVSQSWGKLVGVRRFFLASVTAPFS